MQEQGRPSWEDLSLKPPSPKEAVKPNLERTSLPQEEEQNPHERKPPRTEDRLVSFEETGPIQRARPQRGV